ncbi:hypothetical protein GCM10020219_033050 [Nonomuraea dietziae]
MDVIGRASRQGAVVAFGDSLTDGYGSSPGADNRYPDELAERLAAMGRPRAVLNQGIGGNRVTVDSAWLGDRATSRFRRDALGQPGVRSVIILEGINDIGMSEAPLPHRRAAHRGLRRRDHRRSPRVDQAGPRQGRASHRRHPAPDEGLAVPHRPQRGQARRGQHLDPHVGRVRRGGRPRPRARLTAG